jgi:hypothetical protein
VCRRRSSGRAARHSVSQANFTTHSGERGVYHPWADASTPRRSRNGATRPKTETTPCPDAEEGGVLGGPERAAAWEAIGHVIACEIAFTGWSSARVSTRRSPPRSARRGGTDGADLGHGVLPRSADERPSTTASRVARRTGRVAITRASTTARARRASQRTRHTSPPMRHRFASG